MAIIIQKYMHITNTLDEDKKIKLHNYVKKKTIYL